MNKKRWVWLTGISVGLITLIASIAIPTLNQKIQYETYKVTPTDVVKTVSANGQLAETQLLAYGPSEQPMLISSNGSIVLPAQFGLSLEINQIYVSVGEKVTRGQLLFSYLDQLGQATKVRAQSAGVVRSVDSAEGLRTSGQVVAIGSGKPVISVYASEYDADLLNSSQKSSIELDAINAVFEGAVISVGQVATSISGIKQYEVLVEVKKIPAGARFGMSATAVIEVQRTKDVLAVPMSALLGDAPEVQVLTKTEGGGQSVSNVSIKVGEKGDSLVEVTSGLKAGDLVITGTSGNIPSPIQFGPPRGSTNNG